MFHIERSFQVCYIYLRKYFFKQSLIHLSMLYIRVHTHRGVTFIHIMNFLRLRIFSKYNFSFTKA